VSVVVVVAGGGVGGVGVGGVGGVGIGEEGIGVPHLTVYFHPLSAAEKQGGNNQGGKI
jgi:hypothetical protein